MTSRDRRNAITIAIIAASATIAAALIGTGFWKPQSPAPPVVQQKVENRADTEGAQAPAVAGAKDITITYGQKPESPKPKSK